MWVSTSSLRVCGLGFLIVAGCASASEPLANSESAVIGEMQDGPPTDLPEVVQVLANNRARDFCTGALVAPTRVLTAAHCTSSESYEVRAPHAERRAGVVQTSRAVIARSVARSSDYGAEIEKEDVAILELETPIQVPTYATVEDVGELRDETVRAIAVGRAHADRAAPLEKSKELSVRSGARRGYTTGLMSQYYWSGGDSGGPLFRVDPATGKPTHVIIGVERQPEPPREYFTRITPAVEALLDSRSEGGRCSVWDDGRLHCSNGANARLHARPSSTSPSVNALRTTFSWFTCWTFGEPHAGGNSTWYHTIGDDNGRAGYLPAARMLTPSSLDADPAAYGLARCPDDGT